MKWADHTILTQKLFHPIYLRAVPFGLEAKPRNYVKCYPENFWGQAGIRD